MHAPITTPLSPSSFFRLQKCINHFLNYAASQLNVTIEYHAIKMHMWEHSNASYLCEAKACSWAERHHVFCSKLVWPILPDTPDPPHNIHDIVISKVINTVIVSVQEAENWHRLPEYTRDNPGTIDAQISSTTPQGPNTRANGQQVRSRYHEWRYAIKKSQKVWIWDFIVHQK